MTFYSPGRTSKESCRGCSVPLSMPWFLDKPKEVNAGAAQTMEFLGVTVDTVTMELIFAMKKIRAESHATARAEQVSVRPLERLVGKMNATSQVIPPAPLFFLHLQMALSDIKQKLTVLQGTGFPVSELQGETDVVGQPVEGGRYVDRLRCVSDRIGCSMSKPMDWRFMVPGRMPDAYKLLAATLAVHTFLKSKTRMSVLLRLDNTIWQWPKSARTVSKELLDLAKIYECGV